MDLSRPLKKRTATKVQRPEVIAPVPVPDIGSEELEIDALRPLGGGSFGTVYK